jgi:hypothetical protein
MLQWRSDIEFTNLASEWDRPQLRIYRAVAAQVTAEADERFDCAAAEVVAPAALQQRLEGGPILHRIDTA